MANGKVYAAFTIKVPDGSCGSAIGAVSYTHLSLSKLRLQEDSICYDVGAGTGSVSVEMALRADQGQVFAVEKKDDAVALLYENKQRFAADNLEIIKGEAPEALKELPVPTHAFIGGSSGNLKEIVALLLDCLLYTSWTVSLWIFHGNREYDR